MQVRLLRMQAWQTGGGEEEERLRTFCEADEGIELCLGRGGVPAEHSRLGKHLVDLLSHLVVQ